MSAPKCGKRSPDFLVRLAAQAQASDDRQVLAMLLPQGALQLAAFYWARQLTDSGLANLLAQHKLLIAGGSALAIDKV